MPRPSPYPSRGFGTSRGSALCGVSVFKGFLLLFSITCIALSVLELLSNTGSVSSAVEARAGTVTDTEPFTLISESSHRGGQQEERQRPVAGVAASQELEAGEKPAKELVHEQVAFDAERVLAQLQLPSGQPQQRLVVNRRDPHSGLPKQGGLWPNPETLPEGDFSKRYRSCAVVGNGGVLLRDRYGPAIDAHDAVIRFNDGPTDGFDEHAGSRTTLRLINNYWSKAFTHRRPKGLRQEALMLFGAGSSKLLAQVQRAHPGMPVFFMAPEFSGAARRSYRKAQELLTELGVVEVHGRNSAPSGVDGLFFAMAVCNTVHVYGFGVDVHPSEPYHYHDKVTGVEAAHSFGFQALFLKLLARGTHLVLCVPGQATPDCANPVEPA